MATYTVTGDYITSPGVEIDDPQGTYTLVSGRLAELSSQGNTVLDLLIGEDGDGGLLGEMETAIGTAPTVAIEAINVDTSVALESSGLTLPTFDSETLVDVPTDALDGIDFTGVISPSDATVALSWAEATLPSDIFTALQTLLVDDLGSGTVIGLITDVETALYTRARNRQQADRLAAYNRINNTASQMQHALPSGVLVAALADFEIGANRQDAEIENGIIELQANKAIEWRKFVIQGLTSLDQLLRQTRDSESNRALDASKSLLQGVLQDFSERVKRFSTYWEGKKTEVQAAAERIKAAIDTNKGLIEVYGEQVKAYSSGEEAIANKNASVIKALEQAIANAKNDLEAQIANANALVSTYTSVNSLKERIASDRAQIASHCAIGLLSAANVSASVGYSGTEHSSKSISLQAGLSESHSVPHDPNA